MGDPGRASRPPRRSGRVVEERDAEAVELAVGALGHDLVENAHLRVVAQPAGQYLAQLVTILRLRRGEHLGPHHGLPPLQQRGARTSTPTNSPALQLKRSSQTMQTKNVSRFTN